MLIANRLMLHADADADDQGPGLPARRLDAIDAARGAAIVAMISYHLAWDLTYLRLIATNVPAHPVWRWYAHVIAGSFLVLAGVGLALGHAKGLRPRPFLTRLAIVGGAALAVSVGTYFAFPESYIFFGILHCIALSSVLALPFVFAPAWLTAGAAVLVLAARAWVAAPVFESPLLAFLGLGGRVPVTNDYVPLFPWFGLVLAGVAIGGVLGPSLRRDPERRWHASGLVPRTLVWAGRHSLIIYLLHQVVLLGGLHALVAVTGPNPAAVEAGFMRDCEATCSPAREPTSCRAACTCTADIMKTEGLWTNALSGRLDAEDRARVPALAAQCFARSQAR